MGDENTSATRRAFLQTLGVVATSLAGCGSEDDARDASAERDATERDATERDLPASADTGHDASKLDAPRDVTVDALADDRFDASVEDRADGGLDAATDLGADRDDGTREAPDATVADTTDVAADRVEAPESAVDVTDGAADAMDAADARDVMDAADVRDVADVTDASVIALATLPELPMTFRYGVMSGDALRDRVMIWTRTAPGLRVRLVVVELRGAVRVRVASSTEHSADVAGFLTVEVVGLTPGAWHEYAFVTLDARGEPTGRSALGRVRAALDDGAFERVRFAGVCCTKQDSRPFPGLTHAARRGDLDFFFHNGDTVYTDEGTVAMTRDEYRRRYDENWLSQGFQDLFRATGWYTTWDDHDVANDWNPETFPRARLDAARAVFFEYRAIRRDPSDPNRIWKSARWGRTLELFVLDSRSESLPSTRLTVGQYLSRAQMDWLKAGLQRSTARWKMVLNSVPIFTAPGASPSNGLGRWQGYPAQRNELLDFITGNDIRNVWFLSGDLHYGAVMTVEATGPRASLREVLVGPNTPGGTGYTSIAAPQREFGTASQNYGVFTCDPAADALTVELVSTAGVSLFSRTYPAV